MPATDLFPSTTSGYLGPYTDAFAVTKSDTADLPALTRALWVGGTGNVSVYMNNGSNPVAFTGVPAGALLQIRASRVLSTGTTATAIVALW